jgi:hypothetical protein
MTDPETPDFTPDVPDRLSRRVAQAVHAELRAAFDGHLAPFAGAAGLRSPAEATQPEVLSQLSGLLPDPTLTPGAFVEATVQPFTATGANVQVRFLLGRLHPGHLRALAFLLANCQPFQVKLCFPDEGLASRELWLVWQRQQAPQDVQPLAAQLGLVFARVMVIQCLLTLHFPGLIAGSQLADWAAAVARAERADRGSAEAFTEEGTVWHLAAQKPAAFLKAMEAQAAAEGETLQPGLRLKVNLWLHRYGAALTATEELLGQVAEDPKAPAARRGQLQFIRAALAERVGRPTDALRWLDRPAGAEIPAELGPRVTNVRLRALLALGRTREVLAAVAAGAFSDHDPTCFPHWWRAQALRRQGDREGSQQALAAHEDFFGPDLEARRTLNRLGATAAEPPTGRRR